ncbi:peptidoglycan DD-metalloendopeptidase family protein [Pontibacter russatus]|uniref:peptidoglycan DD-metalloendopeptidase family protein n=1 Tax=Pontibacter russatus TaxID=2694929 RepID=UPI001379C9FF|nr:peptidoglycan DD-metalloendopeptidase family protein [Pontibacter russatus]
MTIQDKNRFIYIGYILLLLLAAGCSGKQTLRGVFSKNLTPHEKYAAKLKETGLDQTALGQEWLQAGQAALQDSITVSLPFKETGYFSAAEPRALAYRFDAREGERIVVNLEMQAREQVLVFMDLFGAPETPTEEARRVASADTTATSLSHEVDDDLPHILRVQPELLRSGQYTVTIQSEPTLAFPVEGKSSRHIASIWGDPRDGGARLHEGVDIFAPRGTPAIASTEGVITRVNVTPRGGKVVWLSDISRRQNLYYAHLDSQLVAPGQRVQIGDTLGLIGNTGNAITTAPHLHFGIYRSGRGATNPYPYLHDSGEAVPAIAVDTTLLANWVRVAVKAANIRLQPSTKSAIYATLPQHTPLQVTGAAADWYRVALPSGTEAYIAGSLVEAATNPVTYEKLATAADLLDEAHPLAAPKDSLSAGSSVAVLGGYNGFKLVRNERGELGWINTAGPVSLR